jgi:hypothetical protein
VPSPASASTAAKYSNGGAALHVQRRPDASRQAWSRPLYGPAAPLQAEALHVNLLDNQAEEQPTTVDCAMCAAGRSAEGWLNVAANPYVFTTELGEPCDRRNALRALQTAAKRAGLGLHTAALCCLGDVVRWRATQGGLGGLRSKFALATPVHGPRAGCR